MTKEFLTRKEFNKILRQRTREARVARGWTQAEIAGFLGIDVEVYKKYENRSPMPHHLIAEFCTLVGISIDFFYTGVSGVPKRASR